jgi:hypothetical protein
VWRQLLRLHLNELPVNDPEVAQQVAAALAESDSDS